VLTDGRRLASTSPPTAIRGRPWEALEDAHGDQPERTSNRFRFQANDVGTLARSEESWEGLLASLLKGYSRKTLDKGICSVLSHLNAEAERRASAA
jgi:hypothetical protein